MDARLYLDATPPTASPPLVTSVTLLKAHLLLVRSLSNTASAASLEPTTTILELIAARGEFEMRLVKA